MRSYTVYIHTTPDGRKYVGMTNCNPRERWSNGRGYTQKVFGSAIEEFGWENILHEIIAEDLTQEEACDMEIALIKKYNTTDRKYGYNVRKGGNIPSEQNGKNPNSKCKMMIIKLTDEEHELLKRDAHAHNMNVSEYIRYLVAKERKEREKKND